MRWPRSNKEFLNEKVKIKTDKKRSNSHCWGGAFEMARSNKEVLNEKVKDQNRQKPSKFSLLGRGLRAGRAYYEIQKG